MARGRRPRVVLTRAEVDALIGACGRGRTGVRNRALLAVLYRQGLRIKEALALAPEDLDEGWLHVRCGKGAKRRTVPTDPCAWELVRSWLELRPASPWLFCTLRGAQVWDSYVRSRMLPILRRRAGIEKRVHPHAFRHTFAFELAQEGVELHKIRRLLGHESLTTTQVYVDHLGPEDLRQVIRARTWRQSAA